MSGRQNIFTIPPSSPFASTLAAGLLAQVGSDTEKLSEYLILLPTRRACRTVQDAFLRENDGKPILLPRLQAIGDIDAEELFLSGHLVDGESIMEIKPAISSLRRQILLSKLIAGLPEFTKSPRQDLALAGALGQLMDQIYTEDLNLSDLPRIVDRDAFAEHWQITVDFLTILSEHWPKILEKEGAIDAADRRNRLINALNTYWQASPPDYPVLSAGTTGSIPATASLLKTIMGLPQGSIILPGLDTYMSDEGWQAIEEGHPQTTLKNLLADLECNRKDVAIWPHIKKPDEAKEKLISDVMLPATATDKWAQHEDKPDALSGILKNTKRYDCATPEEEAALISIILRETLEEKTKTAALITPDRNLARRVAMHSRRWNIIIDDSGGTPLHKTPLGVYLMSAVKMAQDNLHPASLLAFLKHDMCRGAGFKNFRQVVRLLDYGLLRGKRPGPGFDGLRARYDAYLKDDKHRLKPDPVTLELINHLEPILSPFLEMMQDGFHKFGDMLQAHIETAEQMAAGAGLDGKLLWSGEEAEKIASLLAELETLSGDMPSLNGNNYCEIFETFLSREVIRPKYGTHPRLAILGQLEARMVQADRVILAGLNEGIWPPAPDADPWMSRPMRNDFGLPVPERAITLAAHDFVQGFCSAEVFLTRSERNDGAPTVPARWLQRLDTYLEAKGLDKNSIRGGAHTVYLDYLNEAAMLEPLQRPAPTPPFESRPDKLSVTQIETWMKDPYAIYARHVLDLNKLEPLDKQVDAAEKGSLLHEVLQKFIEKHDHNIEAAGADDFITIAKDYLAKKNEEDYEWNFWLPRLMRLAEWYLPFEQNWQKKADFKGAELTGKVTFEDNLKRPFTLRCRADRIDQMKAGGMALIDYKSGGTYSVKKILSGELPQLPLEAMILNQDGFAESGIRGKQACYVGYWKLTGGRDAGSNIDVSDEHKLCEAIKKTREGFLNLLWVFENEDVPYYAIPRLDNPPRFNDYEHLERVKEWAALGEQEGEAA
jgi:ATP-dependent helicase/nuclease subunit B